MLDQTLKVEISATAVAWYGAIVATISTLIALFNYLRDRPKIKIEYRKDIKIIGRQSLYDPSKTYFNITVINKGRRPINITKIAIRVLDLPNKRKFYLLSDSFLITRNRILTEENPTTEFLVEQNLIDFDNAWYISVYDATGQEYRKYLHLFPTFWRIWYFLKFRK